MQTPSARFSVYSLPFLPRGNSKTESLPTTDNWQLATCFSWGVCYAAGVAEGGKPGLAGVEFDFCAAVIGEREIGVVAVFLPGAGFNRAVLEDEDLAAADRLVGVVNAVAALRHDECYHHFGRK